MIVFASVLHLSRADCKALRITDAYSLHRVVYDLFDDVRSESEKTAFEASGILFADQGGDFSGRKILLLSDREPRSATRCGCGYVASKPIANDFLLHDQYRFKVLINPTKRDKSSGKLVAVRGRDEISQWFMAKAPVHWGFDIAPESLMVNQVNVLRFKDKSQRQVTLAQADVQGVLRVTDRQQFQQSFMQGIGRGKAFGCGLLQIAPIQTQS